MAETADPKSRPVIQCPECRTVQYAEGGVLDILKEFSGEQVYSIGFECEGCGHKWPVSEPLHARIAGLERLGSKAITQPRIVPRTFNRRAIYAHLS